MSVMQVSDATFEREVLRSEIPVLIDLFADWCAPCKQLAPIVAEVAREHEGKLKVVKIDIDKSPMIAKAFRVQSIPMLVLLHEGQPVDHIMGLTTKEAILEMIRPVLPASAASVKPMELFQLMAQRRAVAVDVRDEASFRRFHIPGAIHIPSDTIVARAAELRPSDGRVRVLYGRTSDEARELCDKLTEKGVQVGFLEGGFLHWEGDGLEVERGPRPS